MYEIHKTMIDIEFDSLDSDIKGDIYEEFIVKYASEGKIFGQFFTERKLIHSIFNEIDRRCNGPKTFADVYDPAFGTCGFLTEAIKKFKIIPSNVYGQERVPTTYATGLMNLLLTTGELTNVKCSDSLHEISNRKYKLIVTNPPFGMKTDYDKLISDCKLVKKEGDR
jgi:type I restriction-modification system DNA methylase subunit